MHLATFASVQTRLRAFATMHLSYHHRMENNMMQSRTVQKSNRRGVLAAAGLAVMLACSTAQAQTDQSNQNGIAVENGGWSIESADLMKSHAQQFPLMMIFAWKGSGSYLADVDMQVSDSRGKTVLDLKQMGPMVLMGLPAGSYNVKATRAGISYTRHINVTNATRGMKSVMYWPNEQAAAEGPQYADQSR